MKECVYRTTRTLRCAGIYALVPSCITGPAMNVPCLVVPAPQADITLAGAYAGQVPVKALRLCPIGLMFRPGFRTLVLPASGESPYFRPFISPGSKTLSLTWDCQSVLIRELFPRVFL